MIECEEPVVEIMASLSVDRLWGDRDVFTAENMPDDVLDAIRSSRMDPRHNHLNDELGCPTPLSKG
jgi:hypothetical protein